MWLRSVHPKFAGALVKNSQAAKLARFAMFKPLSDGDVKPSRPKNPFSERNSSSTSLTQRPRFERNFDEKEFAVYSYLMDNNQILMFKGLLEGKSWAKFTKGQISMLLNKILTLDLRSMPLAHLIRLAKWAGTGPLRKFDYRAAKTLVIKSYDELKSRRYFSEILVVTDTDPSVDRFNPDRLRESSLLYAQDPSLQARVKSAYEQAASFPEKFSEKMDMLVELSNVSVYIHEIYQSIKLLLEYAATQIDANKQFSAYLAIRVPNYIWALSKITLKDSQQYSKVLTCFMDLSDEVDESKYFYMIYILSVIHLFEEPSDSKLERARILNQKIANCLNQMDNKPSLTFNSKFCYQVCQLMHNLYPEIGPAVYAGTLEDMAPAESNPFKEHFYKLKRYFVTSFWVVVKNRDSKSDDFSEMVSVIKQSGTFVLIWKPSIFNSSRGFEERLTQAFKMHANSNPLTKGSLIGFYEVDFVAGNGKVVEAYSATHYVHNTKTSTIASKVKEKHLLDMGVPKIVYINQVDFDALKSSESQKEYIKAIIAQLG